MTPKRSQPIRSCASGATRSTSRFAGGSQTTARSWALILLLLVAGSATAQELEPRSYRTLPTGMNAFFVAYSFLSGNVLTDPTAPIEDFTVDLQTVHLAYLRSFGIFGRSASYAVTVPVAFLSGSAILAGEPVSGTREGTGDARMKLSVNLLGGPALSRKEFAEYRQGRNLGVSLAVSAPTGQYDHNLLVNLGSHRWGFKPEVGYSTIRGNWILDAAAGVWMFTANHQFFGNSIRRQEPIVSLQGHLSYNFNGGVWLALDGNYFSGGQTTVDGVENDDLQTNSRVGLTLSVPLARRHSLKFIAQTGAFTRVGADFDAATIAYQFIW